MPEKVVLSWSGGKDSAMALEALLGDERYEVVGLLTSVAEEYKRISHHGVREELLDLQAESIGLPLDKLYLPSDGGVPCTNEHYEKLMREALQPYCDAGVMRIAHGDLFLEDLRAYREKNLARMEMRGVFPLWKRDTARVDSDVHSLRLQGLSQLRRGSARRIVCGPHDRRGSDRRPPRRRRSLW